MVDVSGHTEKMANLFDKLSNSYDEVGPFPSDGRADLRPQVRREAEDWLVPYAQPDGSIIFTQEIRNTLGARPIE